jgi:hypothetical protein
MARLNSLRLAEFSDRELLALVVDLRDENAGVVTTQQLADTLQPQSKNPTNCVGTRMGWMRRYGAVERVEVSDGTVGWRLTSVGERIAAGTLKRGQLAVIEALLPEQGLDAALALGQMYRRIGKTESVMLRRGWAHGSGRRS